jgi:hypothetical protein
MPIVSRFVRLVGLGTFPETRGLIVAVARSGSVRGLARRAIHDRSGLVRDLRDVHQARALVRATAMHPATRELAGAGLVFLPGRFLPLGWAATWAANKALRRYVGPIADVPQREAWDRGPANQSRRPVPNWRSPASPRPGRM